MQNPATRAGRRRSPDRPRLGPIHAGLVLRGRIFLSVVSGVLALGLLQWGTDLGAMFLGLAFSVHVSSVLDILIRQGNVRFPAR